MALARDLVPLLATHHQGLRTRLCILDAVAVMRSRAPDLRGVVEAWLTSEPPGPARPIPSGNGSLGFRRYLVSGSIDALTGPQESAERRREWESAAKPRKADAS